MKIVKIVLDIMSPAQQSIVDLAESLSTVYGVSQIDISLSELERNVEDFKVTLEGDGLDFERIRTVIKDFGAVIRNVDSLIQADYILGGQDTDKLSASVLVLAKHLDPKIDNIEELFPEYEKTLKHIKSTRG